MHKLHHNKLFEVILKSSIWTRAVSRRRSSLHRSLMSSRMHEPGRCGPVEPELRWTALRPGDGGSPVHADPLYRGPRAVPERRSTVETTALFASFFRGDKRRVWPVWRRLGVALMP